LWSVIGVSGYLIYRNNSNKKEVKNDLQESEAARNSKYALIKTPEFEAIEIKCDMGRMYTNVYVSDSCYIEIHKSYQKFVFLDFDGKTIKLRATKTPFATKEKKISKFINFYCPRIKRFKAQAGHNTFVGLKAIKDLDIEIDNCYLRIIHSGIQNLNIKTKSACNIQLDTDNYISKLYAQVNPESYFNSTAKIDVEFKIKAKDLKNINFPSLPPNVFVWEKE
jgi:hypothetical protein